MQRWRESRAVVDMTIPHEHSSTGMESSPEKSPQLFAANKKMYSYDRLCGKPLTPNAGKPCVALVAAGENPTELANSTTGPCSSRSDAKDVFVHL
jgi:hypothetical protein